MGLETEINDSRRNPDPVPRGLRIFQAKPGRLVQDVNADR
jgi:hypothetical protein